MFGLPAMLFADDSEDIVFTQSQDGLSEEETVELLDKLRLIILQLTLAKEAERVSQSTVDGCPVLPRNLYIPNTGSDVTALQTFLKNLGSSIYPEGEVTGKYGTLTKKAVERFQVLTNIFGPGQTGYGVTGPVTRATITQYCKANNKKGAADFVPVETLPVKEVPASDVNNTLNNILSGVSISSSVNSTANNLGNSTLFNPNSSSVFLQYLNPSEIQSRQEDLTSDLLRIPSPTSKVISFNTLPSMVSIDSSYQVSFTQSGFSGFDLVSIEGYKDDVQYFFGSTVPALGAYEITIPQEFKDKESFTLLIKHSGSIKDSQVIKIGEETIEETITTE